MDQISTACQAINACKAFGSILEAKHALQSAQTNAFHALNTVLCESEDGVVDKHVAKVLKGDRLLNASGGFSTVAKLHRYGLSLNETLVELSGSGLRVVERHPVRTPVLRKFTSEEGTVDFRNVVELNLARAYYAAQNWGRAIQYYGMVDRGSTYWPEAQFEIAWAHFRGEDMPGSLARLHSLQSPFFGDDWYFAEADLLRIYALFMMCKFPDASDRADVFAEKYEPIADELARSLASYLLKSASPAPNSI